MGDQPAQVHVLCLVGGLSEPESVDPELKGAYSTRVIQGLRPQEMARRAEGRLRGLRSRSTWRLLRERPPCSALGGEQCRAHTRAQVCAGNGFLQPASPVAPVAALTAGPRGQRASVCFPAQRPASGPRGFQEGTPPLSRRPVGPRTPLGCGRGWDLAGLTARHAGPIISKDTQTSGPALSLLWGAAPVPGAVGGTLTPLCASLGGHGGPVWQTTEAQRGHHPGSKEKCWVQPQVCPRAQGSPANSDPSWVQARHPKGHPEGHPEGKHGLQVRRGPGGARRAYGDVGAAAPAA